MLRFIGGPLNFEREDFPFRNFLYPFKFTLEPLSKGSIAKYVCAEMPADPAEPELISKIRKEAEDENGGPPRNRVGKLYEKLSSIFEDQSKLLDTSLLSYTAVILQAGPDDWNVEDEPCLLIKKISSREEAVRVLKSIAEQGEGLRKPHKDEPCPESHFEIFLQMYKEYTGSTKGSPNFPTSSTRHAPSNPTTFPEPFSDKNLEKNRITNISLLLAHLFNVKYRMIIMYLSHIFTIEEPNNLDSSVKKIICSMSLTEMRFLNEIATTLTGLPLKQEGWHGKENLTQVAAPPFELPPSLVFPDRMEDQWRLHASLTSNSIVLIKKIRMESGDTSMSKFFADQETNYYKCVLNIPEIGDGEEG